MHRGLRGAVVGLACAGFGLAAAVAPAKAELNVVVTIKPLHALVANVMGKAGTPELLVTGSASAHTYALKPSDAAKLGGRNYSQHQEGLKQVKASLGI